MKKVKLVFLSFIFFIAILNVTTFAFDYEIENYDISINVNEDNTFDVVEKIKVNFLQPKHGIYRKIALMPELFRSDGSKYMNVAQIENIEVNSDFTTYKESLAQFIKIGNEKENVTENVTGVHDYEIKYTYLTRENPSKDFDELYYCMIGNDWKDTVIKQLSFRILMPKEVDESALEFISLKDSYIPYPSKVFCEVNGNTITGATTRVLLPSESLGINIKLPEGYFTENKLDKDTYPIWVMIICVIFVLIADNIWFKYGKDDKVNKNSIEYYPPKNYNSAEVGFLYTGSAGNKNIISLLIYLANKGYIKIEETENKHKILEKNQNFKITKLKEYDGKNSSEKLFLDGLFKEEKNVDYDKYEEIIKDTKAKGEKVDKSKIKKQVTTITRRDSVVISDLYNDFYQTINEINYYISEENNDSYKIPIKKIILLVIMALIVFVITNLRQFAMYMGRDQLGMVLLIPGYAYMFGVPLLSCLNKLYWIMFAVGNICLIVIIMFIGLMPKSTDHGTEMRERINGFINFIKNAKQEELEGFVKKDQNYFYDNLSYAFSLGITDIYLKKFENIDIKPPTWFYPIEKFSFQEFNKFMNISMITIAAVMFSNPSSGHGVGGFGGGGRRRRLVKIYIKKVWISKDFQTF